MKISNAILFTIKWQLLIIPFVVIILVLNIFIKSPVLDTVNQYIPIIIASIMAIKSMYKEDFKISDVISFKEIDIFLILSIIITAIGIQTVGVVIVDEIQKVLHNSTYIAFTPLGNQSLCIKIALIVGTFYISIMAPIFEEIIFRGIIFKGIKNEYNNKIKAIVISSILFALCHYVPYMMIFAFVFGLILSSIVNKTNNILYSLTLHIANNTLAWLLPSILYLFNIKPNWTFGVTKFSISGTIILVIGLIMLFISLKNFKISKTNSCIYLEEQ